jgi:hypothetical protein
MKRMNATGVGSVAGTQNMDELLGFWALLAEIRYSSEHQESAPWAGFILRN